MSATREPITLGNEWKDINLETGIESGKNITIQVIGGHSANIAIRSDKPADDYRGWILYPLEFREVLGCSLRIWAKVSPKSPETLIQVAEGSSMAQSIVVSNLESIGKLITIQQSALLQSQKDTECAIRLLNARFEEAFETNIEEDDL